MIDDEMATEYIKAYFNWLDVVEPLTDDETGRLFKALLAYGKDGTIPDWVGNERYAFYALKINIDNNQKAYDRDVENGKRGGRPRVQTETPKRGVIEEKPPVLDEKPPVFETKGGVSEENQEKKRKEKIREEKKEDSKLSGKPDDVTEIIDYLNEVCGTHYKPNTPETVRLIRARLKEGFSVEDFNRVIDTMYAKWGSNGDMARYLRPQTLFGTKFESYLNMAAVQTTAQSAPSAPPINKLGFENYTPDPSIKNDLYARAIEMLEAAEKG